MRKPIMVKKEIIDGQEVEVKVYKTKRAYGSGPAKAWTAKSKNYLLNGMNPK